MNASPPATPVNAARIPILAIVAVIALAVVGALLWQALRPTPPGAQLGKLEGDMHALLFTGDGRVLYGQHGGIQFSSDGGQTWSTPSGQGDAMALGPSGASTLYLAGHGVFEKSTDGGQTWVNPGFGDLPGTDIHGFAVAATMEGLIRSTDGGASWGAVPGASSLAGMALAVHPKSGAVYASSAKGVVRSTDDGLTWTELNGPSEAVALVATEARDEAHLMVVSGTGQVYASSDGGKTWKGR